MSAEELAAMDAKIVADTIAEMQRQIEQLTGARHSMYDPAVAIARDIANRTPPAPIKPSGDTGELRERMKRAIWTQLPQEDANMGTSGRIADAILDLIQSEMAGSPIGQNDQPGLAFSDSGEPEGVTKRRTNK